MKTTRFNAVFPPGIIVSCQAQPGEPLYKPEGGIMCLMALAAQQAGAIGIRANKAQDVRQIKAMVTLPVIAIDKTHYPDSDIYVTPTMAEVDRLMAVEGVEALAIDYTLRPRPHGESLDMLTAAIRAKYPHVAIMADIITFEEGLNAWKLGVDAVATTLYGTKGIPETDGPKPNIRLASRLAHAVDVPVIAEGGIYREEHVTALFEGGVYAVVIGGAITRPKEITERYVAAYQATQKEHTP